MLSAAGEAVRVNVEAGVTVRLIAWVLTTLPEVPETVTLAVPSAAVEPAVNITEIVPATPPRAIVAVTPVGSPDKVRVTAPLKPPKAVAVSVLFAEPPCAMPSVAGEAESVKPEGAVTEIPRVQVLVRLPDLPVTVAVAVEAVAVDAAVIVRVLTPKRTPGRTWPSLRRVSPRCSVPRLRRSRFGAKP